MLKDKRKKSKRPDQMQNAEYFNFPSQTWRFEQITWNYLAKAFLEFLHIDSLASQHNAEIDGIIKMARSYAECGILLDIGGIQKCGIYIARHRRGPECGIYFSRHRRNPRYHRHLPHRTCPHRPRKCSRHRHLSTADSRTGSRRL